MEQIYANRRQAEVPAEPAEKTTETSTPVPVSSASASSSGPGKPRELAEAIHARMENAFGPVLSAARPYGSPAMAAARAETAGGGSGYGGPVTHALSAASAAAASAGPIQAKGEKPRKTLKDPSDAEKALGDSLDVEETLKEPLDEEGVPGDSPNVEKSLKESLDEKGAPGDSLDGDPSKETAPKPPEESVTVPPVPPEVPASPASVAGSSHAPEPEKEPDDVLPVLKEIVEGSGKEPAAASSKPEKEEEEKKEEEEEEPPIIDPAAVAATTTTTTTTTTTDNKKNEEVPIIDPAAADSTEAAGRVPAQPSGLRAKFIKGLEATKKVLRRPAELAGVLKNTGTFAGKGAQFGDVLYNCPSDISSFLGDPNATTSTINSAAGWGALPVGLLGGAAGAVLSGVNAVRTAQDLSAGASGVDVGINMVDSLNGLTGATTGGLGIASLAGANVMNSIPILGIAGGAMAGLTGAVQAVRGGRGHHFFKGMKKEMKTRLRDMQRASSRPRIADGDELPDDEVRPVLHGGGENMDQVESGTTSSQGEKTEQQDLMLLRKFANQGEMVTRRNRDVGIAKTTSGILGILTGALALTPVSVPAAMLTGSAAGLIGLGTFIHEKVEKNRLRKAVLEEELGTSDRKALKRRGYKSWRARHEAYREITTNRARRLLEIANEDVHDERDQEKVDLVTHAIEALGVKKRGNKFPDDALRLLVAKLS